MSQKINLPDVGDLDGVEVVEISIKVGDSIEKEQTIITLEGSKASMEIPSPASGVVEEILVKVGDSLTESMPLIVLSQSDDLNESNKPLEAANEQNDSKVSSTQEQKTANESLKNNDTNEDKGSPQELVSEKITFTLPDVGDLDGVEVVEILVKKGDSITKEQALITLEGSKASMEIPSPFDGVIEDILVKVGDGVTEAMPLAIITSSSQSPQKVVTEQKTEKPVSQEIQQSSSANPVKDSVVTSSDSQQNSQSHASPSVRKFARVLGVDLAKVQGSSSKNRIVKEDVEKYVKSKMQAKETNNQSTGSGIPVIAKVDFEKFGAVEYKKLNKIKQISSSHLHASWLNVPHVTQFAEVNAEFLESYRQAKKGAIEKQGYKLTPLILIMKAVVASLKLFPTFNSSFLGNELAIKKYYNIGIAVDTEEGLVVPVIRNVDEKSIFALAKELSEISQKARDKKLTVTDMSGGTFTISNLGGLGAGPFTPIVNAPEVAILGLSKSFIKPVFSSGYFMPQLTMPISLSYDHRVVDGADGARFMSTLESHLMDIPSII